MKLEQLIALLIMSDILKEQPSTAPRPASPSNPSSAVPVDQSRFFKSAHDHPLYIFNPHKKPEGELPVIYGFNNGGPTGRMNACLLAQDGSVIGSYMVAHESYIVHDLCLFGEENQGRLHACKLHYQGGFRFAYVGYEDAAKEACIGLRDAMLRYRLALMQPRGTC